MKKIIILIILIKITFINISICQVDITFNNTNIIDAEFAPAPYNMVTWQDKNGEFLWVADVNPFTGMFYNIIAIDTNIVPMQYTKNGPEWVYNNIEAQIVYCVIQGSTTKLAKAWKDAQGNWNTEILQSVFYPNLSRIVPFGTIDSDSTYPLKIRYFVHTANANRFRIWRELNNPFTETQLPEFLDPQGLVGEISWVENKELIITSVLDNNNIAQVVLYDIRNPSNMEQLTFSPSHNGDSYMWQSANPSFNGRYMFFTTIEYDSINWRGLNIYVENINGGWDLLNQIYPPLQSNFPYIISPDPFIVNGNSYISFTITNIDLISPSNNSQIWVSPADPSLGSPFRVSNSNPMDRRDPEPFVGTNTAWIYYAEKVGSIRILHKCETGL